MGPLDLLLTRRSILPLEGPEPTGAELDALLRAATSAPDHKSLRPWRFVVVRGEGRRRFGEALAAALAEADPRVTPEVAGRQAEKAFRSPMLVAVIAAPRQEAGVPRWEQLASAAAAAQNLTLAAHALGLGAAWRSTSLRDAPLIRDALAMGPHEELLGWIHVGRVPADARPAPRRPVRLSDHVTELTLDGLMGYAGPEGDDADDAAEADPASGR
jgi:nitroreductase